MSRDVGIVERVAMAIAFGRDRSTPEIYAQFADMIKDDLRRQARAAIKAMERPTKEMEEAGFQAGHLGDGEWEYADPATTYKAMMRKAVGEQP